MSNKFLPGVVRRIRQVVIGPERTAPERRLSLLGGVVGALLAVGFGLCYLGYGMATDPFWQEFPPPLAPFVLLPLAAGAVAGLRFTTDLVRPSRLTWKRLLLVTVGVLGYTMTTLTTFAMLSMAFGNGWQSPRELVSSIVSAVVLLPILTVVWTVVPGTLLAPFLAPVVGAFALVMRRLSGATSKGAA